jgi:hypothetical protein
MVAPGVTSLAPRSEQLGVAILGETNATTVTFTNRGSGNDSKLLVIKAVGLLPTLPAPPKKCCAKKTSKRN